ncbi:MAG: hypothetical protein RL414_507 [Actinomycetota bacterium]|jgi:heavy metal translocating P-type ATPase
MLLALALASLISGGSAALLDAPTVASVLWAIGGVCGLIPATQWVIRSLCEREMGSDFLALLALIGTLATQEYFASSIISLMLATGRLLENWAEGEARRQLEALLKRMPRTAHIIDDQGLIKTLPVEDIAIGDRVLVRSGEVIPCDGILHTSAELDESALTGEPLPVEKKSGDEVSSGVLNVGTSLELIATASSHDSTYAGIIRLVEGAQSHAAPSVRIANKWALRFVPVALLLASAAWLISGDIKRAIAVLVTATPCPLILAVPIAIVSGMSLTSKSGAVIKNGGVLEALARAETVLLDKTGTLTHGGPAVDLIEVRDGYSVERVLQLVASLERHSPHVVAHALAAAANERDIQLLPASSVREVHGEGISGEVDGLKIAAGQLKEIPQWLKKSSPLLIGVEVDGAVIGVIGLSDPIRLDSRKVIEELRLSGVKRILLVTGDRQSTANEVAHSVGITEVHANISAAGKMQLVHQEMNALKNTHGSVIVVGDGINDAPALAAAHVGVAMGARGASAASEAADVVIVEDSISKLTHSIRIAKNSRKKALQASGLGIGLSLVAMALGAVGTLDASQGAILQELIDIVAILWALTALRQKQ